MPRNVWLEWALYRGNTQMSKHPEAMVQPRHVLLRRPVGSNHRAENDFLYAFLPVKILPLVQSQNQNRECCRDADRPEMDESAVVSRPNGAVGIASVADPAEEGSADPSERHNLAPQPRAVGSALVAGSQVKGALGSLASHAMDTITES